MTKKYKLALGDVVQVEVSGTFNDAEGVAVPFKFYLNCERKSSSEIRGFAGGDGTLISDVMGPIVKGWKGQTLVLEEDGTPAAFCDDSFKALMDIAGVAQLVYSAYIEEQGAKVKNS